MPDNSKDPSGGGSTPVRRDLHLRLKQDADGNPAFEAIESKSITLSSTGSIDSVVILPDRFHDCGCPVQIPAGVRLSVRTVFEGAV